MVTGVWQIEKKNWLLKATFWVWVKKKVSNLFFILMSLKVLWCGQKGSICPFFNWYLRPFFYKTKKWEGNGKSQRCNGDGRWLMENLAMRNSFSKLWCVNSWEFFGQVSFEIFFHEPHWKRKLTQEIRHLINRPLGMAENPEAFTWKIGHAL